MTKRKFRGWLILGVLLTLFAGVYFGASALVAGVIGRRLQGMVAANLHAELRIGGVRYHFPYGVTVTEASMIALGADHAPLELFKVQQVDLQLAELPGRDKPLLIEKLILKGPSIHLVKTAQGMSGSQGLVKKEGSKEALAPLKNKLSEIFRLRRFAIDEGKVLYEDRIKPNAKPMVWTGLHVDLNTTLQTGAIYGYHLVANDLPLAELAASGSFDIDNLTLVVEELAFKVQVGEHSSEEKLPGTVQEILRANHIEGAMKISGRATVPLLATAASQFDIRLDLPGVTANMPQFGASLDRMVLKVRCSSEIAAPENRRSTPSTSPVAEIAKIPPLAVSIDLLDAGSGDTTIHIEKGVALVDQANGTWKVRDLLGMLTIGSNYDSLPTELQKLFEQLRCRGKLQFTVAAGGPIKRSAGVRWADAIHYELVAFPRDFSIQPDQFPRPIEKLSGSIHLMPGLVRLENLEAVYGGDKLFVAGARLPLNQIDREIRLNEVNGSVDFGPAQHYPPPLEKILAPLHPGGLYTLAGNLAIRPKEKHGFDYKLDISSDRAMLAPTDYRIPVTEVRCDIAATGAGENGIVQISRFEAIALGGRLNATGTIKPGKVLTYQGQGGLVAGDLHQLAEVLAVNGQEALKMSGKAYVKVLVSGTEARAERTLADNFRAKGEFEILEGDFWEVPVIKDLIGGVKVAKEALTAGQAAGTFEIYDQKVDLPTAAVSAPVLGLQGNGIVRFDGQLDLRIVGAPLADWKDKLKRTGIPLVSDAVGAIAGGVQKMLNGATSLLIYEFRVTGTVAKPQISTVPAPFLSDSAANLFGKMLAPAKDEHLIDAVRGKK